MKKATIHPVAAFLVLTFSLSCFLLPSSRAYADYQNPTQYSVTFLESMAQEAGLTPSELIVQVALTTNVTTGYNSTKGTGVSREKSMSENLAALVDTQDFPDWDELNQQQKESWYNRPDQYNAAKFNDWVAAGFGAEQAKTSWYGTGGSNWDWDNYSFKDRLHELGQGFYKLLDGGITVDELFDMTDGATDWFVDYVGQYDSLTVSSTDYGDWPSGAPSEVKIGKTDQVITLNSARTECKVYGTNIPVYTIIYRSPYQSGYLDRYCAFYPTSFKYGNKKNNSYGSNPTVPTITNYYSTSYYTKNGKTFYYVDYEIGMANAYISMPTTSVESISGDSAWRSDLAYQVLFGDEPLDFSSTAGAISDYPLDIAQDLQVKVYLPSGGVTPENTWNVYLDASNSSGGSDPGGSSDVDLSQIVQLLTRNNDLLEQFKFNNLDLKVFDEQLNGLVSRFQFYGNGDLKVHDLGVYEMLSDIYERLAFPSPEQVTEIIGDFDREEYEEKADALLPQLAGVAPFCAFAMLAKVIDYWGVNDPSFEPELDFPFEFMPGQRHTIELDLSWLSDLRPFINFVTLTLLLLALANRTLDILQLEVTS